jgi:hypothetical protein
MPLPRAFNSGCGFQPRSFPAAGCRCHFNSRRTGHGDGCVRSTDCGWRSGK